LMTSPCRTKKRRFAVGSIGGKFGLETDETRVILSVWLLDHKREKQFRVTVWTVPHLPTPANPTTTRGKDNKTIPDDNNVFVIPISTSDNTKYMQRKTTLWAPRDQARRHLFLFWWRMCIPIYCCIMRPYDDRYLWFMWCFENTFDTVW